MSEVNFNLDKDSKIKLYRQLYDKFVEFINTGVYKPDQKLPSIRILATQLNISKNTITKTYDELEKDKYIYSLIKKGYFVQNRSLLKDSAETPPEDQEEEIESSVPTVDSIIRQHKEPIFSSATFEEDTQEETATIVPQTVTEKPESKSTISQSVFSYINNISSSNTDNSNEEYHPFGQLEFRKAIAAYMSKKFNINCESDQIVVSSGVQNLLLSILRLPSLNSPSYKSDGIGLLKLVTQINQGSIPLVKPLMAIPETISQYAEKIIMESNIPTMQIQNYDSLLKFSSSKTDNPISLLLIDNSIPIESNEELSKLLEWVQEIPYRYIIECPVKSNDLSPLKAGTVDNRIIYINSFMNLISNTFTASFAILPQGLLNEYQQRFNHFSCSVSLLEQKILTDFINKEYLD